MLASRRPRVTQPRTRGRKGTVIGGKWLVEKGLAVGGMASVYAAKNVSTGFRVAIKILNDDCARHEETRKRFLKEGYFANAVDHEGVVSVIDDGVTDDGAPFLIMELLEGETLEERRARSGGTMSLHDVVDVVLSIAEVLAAAHDAKLVHRDVKPQNVFLTQDGRVKVLDFGIAGKRQATEDATRTGAGYGTPLFMAPEQISGTDRIDARADVFALATTMYRLLSGKYPYDAASMTDYFIATTRSKPPRLDELVPEVSVALADVVHRALSGKADERHPDARAFASAVTGALHPERADGVEQTVALSTLRLDQPDIVKTTVMSSAPRGPSASTRSAPPPPPSDDVVPPGAGDSSRGSHRPPPHTTSSGRMHLPSMSLPDSSPSGRVHLSSMPPSAAPAVSPALIAAGVGALLLLGIIAAVLLR